jgi:hypothetical protein
MTVIISKTLRDEVISAARAKLPVARVTLEKMYLAHAQKVARRRRRKLTDTERARISSHVTQFLSL